MKKKIIGIVIIFLILITILIIMILANKTEEETMETEITPLEEITEEQERQTIVSLYYTNTETNTLMPEARIIDAKELVENPYKKLIELIIDTPKNDKLESSIPEGTIVNSTTLEGSILKIDLSKEFIENQTDAEKANLAIYAIVNTLTELNEVTSIRILIDGEENKKSDELQIDLSEIFIRTD